MIFINSSTRDGLKIFQAFLPIFPPIGIGLLMAVLSKNNIKSMCFDEQVEGNLLMKIDKIIDQFEKPYIFGFNVLTASLNNAVSLARELKYKYPDSYVVFGGIHSTAMPDEVLAYDFVDIAVRGEAEGIITELYYNLKNNVKHLQIESVSYKYSGRIIHNKRTSVILKIDDFSNFPYHIFGNTNYDMGFIMSSRGCPHDCIFCSNKINSTSKFRYRNPDNVVDELIMLYKNYNRRYVYFIDDNLLANKNRVIELSRKIRKSEIHGKMIFNFQARGDNADYEVLKELLIAGFKGVYYGIETASEKLMKSLNKGETVEQVVEAIKISKQIGMHVSGNYIFGLPSETHQDRMQAIQLTKELDLDLVKYNNATPYPGTELYNHAKDTNRLKIKGIYENINSVSTFIENPFKKIPFSYVPENNSEGEIRHDILLGYLKFYFRFKRLKGVFTKPDLNNAWFDFGHSYKDFFRKSPGILILFFYLFIKFGIFIISHTFYILKSKKQIRK